MCGILETKCECGKLIRSSLKKNYRCRNCGKVYTPAEFEASYIKRRDARLNNVTELEQNERLMFEGMARENIEPVILYRN